jgi:KaiC/GvpD/RAD55 family RecA-like ATPase
MEKIASDKVGEVVQPERVTTGIPALDEMLGGGLLPGHVIVVSGPTGAGKTIFALQFIYAHLRRGKRCLYISASDDEQSVINNAISFGWDLRPYIASGQLDLRHLEIVEIDASSKVTSDYLDRLPKAIQESGAEIVALDSITEYDDLCRSDIERRGRMLHLRRIIKDMGGTAIFTSESSADQQGSKYGIAEYASDGLILLRHYQPEDFSLFLYIIQIKKMRWIKHSRDMRAYSITDRGIEIQSPLYTILASAGKIR